MTTPTWSQGANYAYIAEVLEATRPGHTWPEWHASLHAILPQAGVSRRKDILEFVHRHCLDGATRVQATRFLSLFQEGSPHRKRTLVHARVAYRIPIVRAAVDFLDPWRRRLGQPLVPDESLQIPLAAWIGWATNLTGKASESRTLRESVSNTVTHLAACGCLQVKGIRPRIARVQRAEPDRLAAAWLIAYELRATGQSEASESSIVRDSFAARLFCLPDQTVIGVLEAGVTAGLLSRSYLMGVPRYHPLPETDVTVPNTDA